MRHPTGLLPRPDRVHRVGDALYWKPCDDGSIRAWAFFAGGGPNVGEPTFGTGSLATAASGFWLSHAPPVEADSAAGS